jgi:hypothetical protein
MKNKQEDGKSGMSNKSYRDQALGGNPPKKDKEAIEKANDPSKREKAPGSVRQ